MIQIAGTPGRLIPFQNKCIGRLFHGKLEIKLAASDI
jgi:hypothetical protein